MNSCLIVGRIVKMDDVPYSKGSVGYEFIEAQRRHEAEALQAAKDRLCEAALKVIYPDGLHDDERRHWDDLVAATDALRKLKGGV